MRRNGKLFVGVWCLLMATGCGGYASVSGQVLLDGKPLANATVSFQPEKGRASYGRTDAQGNYRLSYTDKQDGVRPGKCVVRITTAEERDEGGKAVAGVVRIVGRLRPGLEQVINRQTRPVVRVRHQVGVHAEGERLGGVAEHDGQLLDVHPSGEHVACEQVP